ncbi:MAG: SUF system NifU family Fe-S cluster assembly protein [Armatimonadetes bacterium]|nr:SUF system NifU family Fe-S cluster assembly protein [Armatimonadota bacterium]
MNEIDELYQETILDHNRTPRNYGRLAEFNRRADGYNPLCGDRITVYAQVDGETLSAVGFESVGCAISKASASMMTEALKGKAISEVDQLFAIFHRLITTGEDGEELGKLAAFGGISSYPTRVKCASLAWHALQAAIHDQTERVTTE